MFNRATDSRQKSVLTSATSTTMEAPHHRSKTINALQIHINATEKDSSKTIAQHVQGHFQRWVDKTVGHLCDVKNLFDSAIKSGKEAKSEYANLEVISIENDGIWAAKFEDCSNPEGFAVLHEIEVLPKAVGASLTYRQTILRYSGIDHKAPRSIPSFIKDISQNVNLCDGSRPVDGKAWVISHENDLELFHAFLNDSDRKLPVYMVTETHRSEDEINTLVDFEELAKESIGVAHIVLMTYAMGYEWTQKVGKWLSAYLGTVRTYQPNTAINEENKHKHPLAMPDRIINWEHDGEKGPEAFAKFLKLQAMQASCTAQGWRENFVPMSSIKSKALEGEFNFSEDAQWSELERRYKKRIEVLEARIFEMSQEAIAAQTENTRLRAENSQLVSRNYQLEKKTEKPAPAGKAEKQAPSISLDDWIERHLRLVRLSKEAKKALARSEVLDSAASVSAMEVIASDVRNAFMAGEDITKEKGCRQACKELNATIESIESSFDADRFFVDSETGEEFSPRFAMKIPGGSRFTFDFDRNSNKVIIGSLPH